MEIKWGRDRDLKSFSLMRVSGYIFNSLIATGSIFGLAYPLLPIESGNELSCTFKTLTGFQCPGCGYTRSVRAICDGDTIDAFRYNVGWPLLIAIQVVVLYLSIRSIARNRQFSLSNRSGFLIGGLLMGIWIIKLMTLDDEHF